MSDIECCFGVIGFVGGFLKSSKDIATSAMSGLDLGSSCHQVSTCLNISFLIFIGIDGRNPAITRLLTSFSREKGNVISITLRVCVLESQSMAYQHKRIFTSTHVMANE